MKDHELRVVEERNELNIKIAKLESFLESETYENLSEEEKDLLEEQLECMSHYSSILTYRINGFHLNHE